MLTGKTEQKIKAKFLKKFMKDRPTDDQLKSWHRGWDIPAIMESRRKK